MVKRGAHLAYRTARTTSVLSLGVLTMFWLGTLKRHPRVTTFFAVPYQDLASPPSLQLLRTFCEFVEFPHLFCLSIASSSSSSDRGEMLSTRNPGKFSEAVVSICISST